MRTPVALSFVALTVTLLLAGCGEDSSEQNRHSAQSEAAQAGVSTPDPAASPASNPVTPGTECGVLNASAAIKAKIIVREGAVDCGQANDLLSQYFHKLTPADFAKPDGAGPMPVGRWTCASGPIPASTDVAVCSTEDGRQVEGVTAN